MSILRVCNCSTCVEKRLADATLSPSSKLMHLRRVGVDEFSGDEKAAGPVREMLFGALCATQRWVVMENPVRADAVFKGHIHMPGASLSMSAADDLGLSANDSVAALARMAVMAHVARQQAAAGRGGVAELTLRLTTHSGIVLWAASEQMAHAKGRSVASDLVERAVRELIRTIEREEEEMAPVPESGRGLAALNRVLHDEDAKTSPASVRFAAASRF